MCTCVCARALSLAFQHVGVTARVCLLCLCSGLSVWASQCMCVHAHVGGVCWGQLSLSDQLIKRCTLGYTSVFSLSSFSPSLPPSLSLELRRDLGSVHSPIYFLLCFIFKELQMQIKRRCAKLIFCNEPVYFCVLYLVYVQQRHVHLCLLPGRRRRLHQCWRERHWCFGWPCPRWAQWDFWTGIWDGQVGRRFHSKTQNQNSSKAGAASNTLVEQRGRTTRYVDFTNMTTELDRTKQVRTNTKIGWKNLKTDRTNK